MKKKMKKLFSKLTILVLLVAMLIPYTSIPKVEAAETCEGGEWEYHTNYYFFLQAEHPHTWATYFAENDGEVATNYYTSFLYNFPNDGSKIVFEDEGFVKITDDDDYASDFDAGDNRKTWTAGQYYKEARKEAKSSEFGNELKTYAFKSGNGTSSDNRVVTYLFHGDWAYVGSTKSDENISWDLNNIDLQSDQLDTTDESIRKLVNSSILINKNDASLEKVKVGAGVLNGKQLYFDIQQVQTAIINYNNGVGEGTTVSKPTKLNQPVVNLVIHREYETTDVFENNVTLTKTEEGIKAGDSLLSFPAEGEAGYIKDAEGNILSEQQAVVIEKDNKEIAWFLAPTLYQMSYKVCKAGTDATEDSVTLTYYGNEEYVNTSAKADKVPSAQTEKLNSEGKATFTVSATEPTLEGYTFQNWNTSKDCKGKTIEPETKLENVSVNTPLYACWGETGTTNNGKTGVMTYAGLFTGIIALAGTSYYIMKKKNVFKKI